jgi:methylglutaconyl-CoA hydratase
MARPGPTVTVRVTDGVIARVAIDVPRTRNALSTAVLDGLAEAIRRLSQRDDTRVIVLTGEGSTFSSGADLKENAPVAIAVAAITGLYDAIAQSPKPVLARVEGHCLGLAVGVVAACDLAIAASDTSFGLPEPRLGQAPTLAALSLIPRLRPSDASEVFLTGAMFDGARADALGLVNESVAASELDAAVRRWTDRLTAGGPGAVAACKKLVLALRPAAQPEALALAADLATQLAAADEADEGATAFRERRPPRWATAGVGAEAERDH